VRKILTVIIIALLCLSAFSILAPQVKAETSWTKYSGNPLNLGDNVVAPWVILDGTTYKMWYCSNGEIYYATSSDGISWSIYGIVLQKGAADSWEAWLSRLCVILDGATYKMWYTGYSPIQQFARIGYAISSDGISWTRYEGNPILSPGGNGGWDDWSIHSPSVLKDGSAYRMWYGGQDYQYSPERIGYATSFDGISWTKYSANPVLVPGGNGGWDDKHVTEQFVTKEGATYKMYYTGNSYSDIVQIGLATSIDGTSWTKYDGNPILPMGSPGEWDSFTVACAVVVLDGSAYKMWYQGYGPDSTWRIGLASRSASWIISPPYPNGQVFGFQSTPNLQNIRGTWRANVDPSTGYGDAFASLLISLVWARTDQALAEFILNGSWTAPATGDYNVTFVWQYSGWAKTPSSLGKIYWPPFSIEMCVWWFSADVSMMFGDSQNGINLWSKSWTDVIGKPLPITYDFAGVKNFVMKVHAVQGIVYKWSWSISALVRLSVVSAPLPGSQKYNATIGASASLNEIIVNKVQ
jgi:hypothetical protein